MDSNLLEKLRSIVGDAHVLSQERVQERATHFWDSTPLTAKALVRPANTEETSAVLKACHEVGQQIVTHGGVTGLVGGNLSTENEIVLSLERQRGVESLDSVGRTVTVQAGTVLQEVQMAASNAGLQLGLDLGARGSCTIGGNLATNAGGLSVLRYGMTREQVLGLEVVLADGTIVSSMNSMMKNNAGYDLKHLFIGSEGTLGIITRVVLRLRAATPHVHTALLACEKFSDVASTLSSLDTALNGTLDAFEVIWQPFYRLNTQADRNDTARAPLSRDYPLYAIVEMKSAADVSWDSGLESALEKTMEQGFVVDATVAKSQQERANIWHIREHIEIALEHEPVFVYDISLPIADMDSYTRRLQKNVQETWPEAKLYIYGHLADGNLHVLIAPPVEPSISLSKNTQTAQTNKAETSQLIEQWHQKSNELVYEPLQALGGSISAEHGIGLLKKEYLHLSRSDAEIGLMKTLKQTLDPKSILNRGKIIDVS